LRIRKGHSISEVVDVTRANDEFGADSILLMKCVRLSARLGSEVYTAIVTLYFIRLREQFC